MVLLEIKVNFKIYDVTTWLINNFNTRTANISQSKGEKTMRFGQLIKYNKRNIFSLKIMQKMRRGE